MAASRQSRDPPPGICRRPARSRTRPRWSLQRSRRSALASTRRVGATTEPPLSLTCHQLLHINGSFQLDPLQLILQDQLIRGLDVLGQGWLRHQVVLRGCRNSSDGLSEDQQLPRTLLSPSLPSPAQPTRRLEAPAAGTPQTGWFHSALPCSILNMSPVQGGSDSDGCWELQTYQRELAGSRWAPSPHGDGTASLTLPSPPSFPCGTEKWSALPTPLDPNPPRAGKAARSKSGGKQQGEQLQMDKGWV